MEAKMFKNFPENGKVVVTNYKKGELSQTLFNLMNSDTINKGEFLVSDSFTKYPWQKAYDFTIQVKNYLKKDAKYQKLSYIDLVEEINYKVDILVGDVTTVQEGVTLIESYYNLMNARSTCVLKIPVLLQEEFKGRILSKYTDIKVESKDNFSYINFIPQKVIKPKKVTREWSSTLT